MNIATVGSGFIVSNFIEAAQDAGVSITAVFSRDAERARALCEKHGIKNAFSDRDALLSAPEIDCVYVASPNALHFAWARDALLAGKHVICEKPFTSTARELEALIAIARDKGLFLFEAITVPHLPNFRIVREKLPAIGQIKAVQLNFSQYSSRYAAFLRGEEPNVFNPAFSGGALMDINYYNLVFALELFGEPRSIAYTANLADNGIDTSGVLTLRYDGFFVTAVGCKDSRSANSVQIQGDGGFIHVPEESSRCVSVRVLAGGDETTYNVQDRANVLYYELLDFAAIVEARDFARRDALLEASLRAMTWTDRARADAGIRFPADDGVGV